VTVHHVRPIRVEHRAYLAIRPAGPDGIGGDLQPRHMRDVRIVALVGPDLDAARAQEFAFVAHDRILTACLQVFIMDKENAHVGSDSSVVAARRAPSRAAARRRIREFLGARPRAFAGCVDQCGAHTFVRPDAADDCSPLELHRTAPGALA
jgi:hypothetical protein